MLTACSRRQRVRPARLPIEGEVAEQFHFEELASFLHILLADLVRDVDGDNARIRGRVIQTACRVVARSHHKRAIGCEYRRGDDPVHFRDAPVLAERKDERHDADRRVNPATPTVPPAASLGEHDTKLHG